MSTNKKIRPILPLGELKRWVTYDPNSGVFTWLSGRWAGRPCRSFDKTNGYCRIKINGFLYKAHRLAWLYHYGVEPNSFVDHINCNRKDNRIVNLRLATMLENNQNSSVSRGKSSKYRGVSWNERCKKWRACISHNGQFFHLGNFSEEIEARDIYLTARSLLHPFATTYKYCRTELRKPSPLIGSCQTLQRVPVAG